MRIVGLWLLCDDGITRPTIRGEVVTADGKRVQEDFLSDTGADRTVLCATIIERLGLATDKLPRPAFSLEGIGGASDFLLLPASLEFLRDDGVPIQIRGDFAVFTDITASDRSVLGRDVLDNFSLIVSRPRNEVLLLAGNHRYEVVSAEV